MFARPALLALALAWSGIGVHAAGLQLQCSFGDQAFALAKLGCTKDKAKRDLDFTRCDLLLSSLEVQRADGSWLPTVEPWHAHFRAHEPWREAPLPTALLGECKALRFAIGVDRASNHADPNRLAPDHALHPVSTKLHWGWQQGYIFMALEGHWQMDGAPAGITGGFSYHLGNDENLIIVELAQAFTLQTDTQLRLRLDLRPLLAAIDIAKDGDSTHSRTQDAIVKAMKAELPRAFSLSTERREMHVAKAEPTTSPTPRGTPYPLHISGTLPTLKLPADNALTLEGVALGKRLFHDTRLSRDATQSCASCHDARHAFADPRAFSLGVDGKPGKRHAMPIFNLAWQQGFFWDGRAATLREQALMPIQDHLEMAETLPRVVEKLSADATVVRDFERVFGTAQINAERIGLALEQFMHVQIAQDSKFDRMQRGDAKFTAQEQRGFELFLTEHDPLRGLRGADCFHCHGGGLFTNHQFVNIGLKQANGDLGREQVTKASADRNKFRTPSLRNVGVTAPYMHDGRFATLEEVIEHYDHSVERQPTLDPNLAKHPKEGLKLSKEDKAALVAFLKTLTEEQLLAPQSDRSVVKE